MSFLRLRYEKFMTAIFHILFVCLSHCVPLCLTLYLFLYFGVYFPLYVCLSLFFLYCFSVGVILHHSDHTFGKEKVTYGELPCEVLSQINDR